MVKKEEKFIVCAIKKQFCQKNPKQNREKNEQKTLIEFKKKATKTHSSVIWENKIKQKHKIKSIYL